MKVFIIPLLFLSLSVVAQNDDSEQSSQQIEIAGTESSSEDAGLLNEPASAALGQGPNEDASESESENVNEVEDSSNRGERENIAAQDETPIVDDGESEGVEADPKLEASESILAEEDISSTDPALDIVEASSEAIPVDDNLMPDPVVRQGTEVVNLSATIVGNQEQPTVLYIVPWKAAEDTTILYLPLSSKAMEHIFGHVERVEHKRQVQYIEHLDKQ